MRLAGGHRHDAVGGHGATDVEHEAVVAGQEAVAEDAEAPRIVVRRALDGRHRLQVGGLHHAYLRARTYGGTHDDRLNNSLTRQRSVQAFAFSTGLRRRYAGWYVTTSGVLRGP